MDDSTLSRFRGICTAVCAALPTGSEWQWDDRFEVGLASFDTSSREAMLAALRERFPLAIEAQTLKAAPKDIQKIIKDVFDLKAGQLVFAAEQESDAMLLAAWWPWGDGQTTSLRIGVYPRGGKPFDAETAHTSLAALLPLS
ncbi:MAG TPA: hypothetical protein PKM65_06515 [Spirochaetota bacterium]|nr:hypothetical protein [Spirochaetota bacterium]HNT09990.1 hypothetical protein [Spirochaetota bacterium]